MGGRGPSNGSKRPKIWTEPRKAVHRFWLQGIAELLGKGQDIVIRDKIFSAITEVSKCHRAVKIDTPVGKKLNWKAPELTLRTSRSSIWKRLSDKYGEHSKLNYDLADQGGEACSLRCSLAVPFVRWLAMNRDTQSTRRYHVAKVYRRDQPAITNGRMREVYHRDFDIGTWELRGRSSMDWAGKNNIQSSSTPKNTWWNFRDLRSTA